MPLKPVQPGELITSARWNESFAYQEKRIDELAARLTKLETSPGSGTGKPEILSPGAGDLVRIGDELQISGRNFGDASENIVFLDSIVPINLFKQPEVYSFLA